MQVSAAGGTSTFLQPQQPGRLSPRSPGRIRELWEQQAGVPSSGSLLVYISPVWVQQL